MKRRGFWQSNRVFFQDNHLTCIDASPFIVKLLIRHRLCNYDETKIREISQLERDAIESLVMQMGTQILKSNTQNAKDFPYLKAQYIKIIKTR